jgi:hypothetical protein
LNQGSHCTQPRIGCAYCWGQPLNLILRLELQQRHVISLACTLPPYPPHTLLRSPGTYHQRGGYICWGRKYFRDMACWYHAEHKCSRGQPQLLTSWTATLDASMAALAWASYQQVPALRPAMMLWPHKEPMGFRNRAALTYMERVRCHSDPPSDILVTLDCHIFCPLTRHSAEVVLTQDIMAGDSWMLLSKVEPAGRCQRSFCFSATYHAGLGWLLVVGSQHAMC